MGQTRITLTVDVTEWTDRQREELLSFVSAIESQPAGSVGDVDAGDIESTGWTLDAYEKVMAGLLGKHFAQATSINEAIRRGTGYVAREEVYELAGYPETRSLRGFTRPVNRVMDEQVEAGVLPEDAAPLLESDYDPAVKGYQRAKGFRVPLEVVKLLTDHQNRKVVEGD